MHHSISQMKHQLHATLCISLLGPSALIRRCDDLPTTITHVPVAAVLVLNNPDDGRLRPKHVEWPCRNKTCTVLHQVGVSLDLFRINQQKVHLMELYCSWSMSAICFRCSSGHLQAMFYNVAETCSWLPTTYSKEIIYQSCISQTFYCII